MYIEYPQYILKNETKSVVGYRQEGMESPPEKLYPMKEVAYTWNSYEEEKKKLVLYIGEREEKYSLDKFKKMKDIVTGEDSYQVELINKGFTKVLRVRSKRLQEAKYYSETSVSNVIGQLSNKSLAENFLLTIRLKGLGLSFVTNDPKELLYISIYHLQIKLSRNSIQSKVKQTDTELKMKIGHIQVDNMLDKSFPTIFTPKKLFHKDQIGEDSDIEDQEIVDDNTQEEDHTPFIQISIYIYIYIDILEREIEDGVVKIHQFPVLQFSIQEMTLNVDQEILNEVLHFVNHLISLFKGSDEFLHIEEEHKQEIIAKEIWEVIPTLKARAPSQPDSSLVDADKLYIRMLHLGALKLTITLRLEKQVWIYRERYI